ncbi:sugar transferase [Butyricimonas virosa]|uniref:sugar transferase n=1 Tax=Butyricimonas virosa TaxID=544645 RepID=UPI00242E1221|nr:sugar transferase [Butyricimonas virosa]
MYVTSVKKVLDFVIALIGVCFLSPFLSFVALLLFIAHRSFKGIFFVQSRVGYKGRIFKILKFKTMSDQRDEDGVLLPDAERLTLMGKIVRSLSIDELPQLINVLKGDMAFVGPRPLLPKYLPLYSKEQLRRHEVRPGITGWAQINGRNNISWTRKFEYDVWYVDHVSFWLDLKILFLTIKKVFVREGISKEGEVTTVPFDGTN